tara:strand:- start:1425 stop:1544 length:120 start_codon:yes stop_codon:yes gene_type:complete
MTYELKNKFFAGFAALFSAAIIVSASIAPAVNSAGSMVI